MNVGLAARAIQLNGLTFVFNQDDVKFALEQYSFHEGLDSFREPEKQQAAMLQAIQQQEAWMTIALEQRHIIGYTIVLSPEPDERWNKLDFIKMLGVIEVAPTYRKKKAAYYLLQCLLEHEVLEKSIIVSLEYCWHWDLSMTGGDPVQYMKMLKRVLQTADFTEYETNEPDIAAYDVNFMMARIGSSITMTQIYQFLHLAKPF